MALVFAALRRWEGPMPHLIVGAVRLSCGVFVGIGLARQTSRQRRLPYRQPWKRMDPRTRVAAPGMTVWAAKVFRRAGSAFPA